MADRRQREHWQRLAAAAEREYIDRHPRSRAIMTRMSSSLPGGDTRSTTWFSPFPLVMESGQGARLHSVDGETLLDFLGNYTLQIHGHRAAVIEEGVRSALERGFLLGAPMEEQATLAELLISRIPSAELVRFTNSGSEATMLAARIARRFTGRRRLAVARYSYHGSFEELAWEAAQSTGTVVFPPDDADEAERVLRKAQPLAAVFIEPVLGSGGVLSVPTEVLLALRRVTQETGALLVFDEVMSFRLSHGGAQECVGVLPDMTALGKIVGGGLPIGAVVGRADILEITDPRRDDHLEHGGTFNGSRLAMAAGIASLEALDRQAIERLNRLGDKLAGKLMRAAAASALPVSVTHVGSLLNLHPARGVCTPAAAETAAASPLRRYLHLSLVDRGVFLAKRLEMCLSTPMTERDIDVAVDAFRETLAEGERLLMEMA